MSTINDEMNAAANYAIKSAKDNFGQELDFSEHSIDKLENLLNQAYQSFSNLPKDEKTNNAISRTAKIWGSYLGEFMRLKWGGTWILRGSERLVSIGNIEFSPIWFINRKITIHPEHSVEKYILGVESQINQSIDKPQQPQNLSENKSFPYENNLNNPLWIEKEKAYIEPEKKMKKEKSEIQPEQPTKKKRKVWLIILIVVIVLLFLCCAGYYIVNIFLSTSTNGTSSSIISRDLVFQNLKTERITDLQTFLVTGEVKNISSTTYSFVKVRIWVYDKSGNQIGENWSYIDSDTLPSNAISTFSVYVDCKVGDVSTYKYLVEE